MNSEFNPKTDAPDTTVCPVSGWPIVRRPEWIDVRLDDNYWTTVEVIGGHIIRSIPVGYATRDGVEKINALHRDAMIQAIAPGAAHIHIADYTAFEGTTPEGRRAFADDIREREGLAALIFHNVSPLFRLSIKLGRRLLGLHMPVEIAPDYAAAIRRAIAILKDEGVDGLPAITQDPPAAQQPETGALDLDGYTVQYRILDGRIVHGKTVGYLGIKQMERHIEFEAMILSSLDRARGTPVIVADVSDLDGISAAARRLYVASLRNRQRINPVAIYICYGVDTVLRSAINMSRPFLPFRIRIARDEKTAIEIARRSSSVETSPVSRIRSLLFPATKANRFADQAHLDDLLRLLANIDWENDGPVENQWEHSTDHPLAPVVDTLELIKADVNELLRARTKTEQALRQSEERYRTILESIVDGYYEINLRGEVMFCNDAMLKIFGFPRSEIEDFDALSLLAPETREDAIGVFTKVYETGEPAHSIEWEIRTRDSTLILIEMSISTITDVDGERVGFRGIVRDVTDRIRTAQEKANLEAQLQRSQRVEAIGTLAGGIAHNFNNLLMGIQGNISLLARDHSPDGPHAKRLATMETLVEGGSKLTSQLLGYARSGRVDIRVVDLNSLAHETAETFSLTRKEYRVHADFGGQSMPIEVDPAQIEQALLNLLINAADAMPREGDIFLTSRLAPHTELKAAEHEVKAGNHVVLSVRDTGHGMDQDTMDRCFEPFFTTKGISGGTGLGLASAYGIIRAHGGHIEVESTVGEGTTFSFSFPTTARAPDAVALQPGLPVEGEGTILVVEDDEAVLDACSEMLTFLQYTPILAGSGEAAIDIFRRKKDEIDLVVLDLILTDLNGGEVFDRIRAIDPDVRVLLSSGYSLEGEAAGILERGCDDFIQKPFTIEQLSHKLERLLRRGSRS